MNYQIYFFLSVLCYWHRESISRRAENIFDVTITRQTDKIYRTVYSYSLAFIRIIIYATIQLTIPRSVLHGEIQTLAHVCVQACVCRKCALPAFA